MAMIGWSFKTDEEMSAYLKDRQSAECDKLAYRSERGARKGAPLHFYFMPILAKCRKVCYYLFIGNRERKQNVGIT
jgi:hypothetical protein